MMKIMRKWTDAITRRMSRWSARKRFFISAVFLLACGAAFDGALCAMTLQYFACGWTDMAGIPIAAFLVVLSAAAIAMNKDKSYRQELLAKGLWEMSGCLLKLIAAAIVLSALISAAYAIISAF